MMRMRFVSLLFSVLLWAACSTGSSVVSPDADSTVPPPDAATPDTTDAFVPDLPAAPDTFDAGPDLRFDAAADVPLSGCEPGEGCFLDPCSENAECQAGWCVEHMGAGVCSLLCQEECPPGWSCRQVGAGGPDIVWACISDHANLCKPCAASADCKAVGGADDVCVRYGADGSFCGGACEDDADCPWGFGCQEVETVDGIALTQCVAEAGVCPCTEKSIGLGLWTPCEVAGEAGTCQGKRVCTQDGLTACDAPAPAVETCNGIDDDCDGLTDEPHEEGGDFVNLCDDGNECTKDTCGGESGCTHEELSAGECKDGDACTVGDHCEAGTCVGLPVACDDDNPCTDDFCDGQGGCTAEFNQAPCDDSDPCTVNDQCQEGACTGFAIDCECQTDADCAAFEDGDVCNGTLYCDTAKIPYLCRTIPESIVTCPEPSGPDSFCLQAACDPQSGECQLLPHHEGAGCDDGNGCTIGDHCEDGVCTSGVPMLCDDSNDCTDDACDPDVGCVFTPNDDFCDDGNVCTGIDQCVGGQCQGTGGISCDDSNPCTSDTCDPQAGCQYKLNEAPCDDDNVCTIGDHCHLGDCIAAGTLTCDDGNPCTDDACKPQSGCSFSPNAAPCDDANACTENDSCAGGWCAGGPALTCDDGNPCTQDSCDPVTGCQQVPLDAGECSDGDACTVGDQCAAGQCASGAPLGCDDDNPCTDDLCDPVTGCVNTPNEEACNDGDACTDGDACVAGECASGESLDCDDADACTQDSCDPATGCVNAPLEEGAECGPGKVCVGGTCTECAQLHGQAVFDYTGSAKTFVVPECVESITVTAEGAAGGNGAKGAGAKGGRVTAVVPVTPGETLTVRVGGKGVDGNGGAGGFNGGGKGGAGSGYAGGGGGGASDVRRGGDGLEDRILVAGGGGGGGADGCNAQALTGGAGGGLTGGNGQTGTLCSCDPSGHGGTQNAGGKAGEWDCNDCNSTNGSLGQGGNGNTDSSCGGTTGGGGGGGGWYGGGGGGLGAGGGGSSYTAPDLQSVQHTQGTRSGNGRIQVDW